MKRILFLLTFISSAALAETLVYSMNGTHSLHGSYRGILHLTPGEQGEWRVQRIIRFDQLKFKNLNIESVWQGVGRSKQEGLLDLEFELNRFHFITRFENTYRDTKNITPAQAKVLFDLDSLNGLTRFVDPFSNNNAAYFSESYHRISHADVETYLNEYPLYLRTVEKIDVQEPPSKSLKKILEKLFAFYTKNPLVQSYAHRQEFQRGVLQFTLDKSDFATYQAQPQDLRIINAPLDAISFAEEYGRHQAFSQTLESKEEIFRKDLGIHINEVGFVCFADFSGEQFLRQSGDVDSLLWTGVYIATEAYRYKVTKDPAALNQIKKSVRGLMLAMDITGDPGEFARTVMKYRPGLHEHPEWRRGEGFYRDYIWLTKGNNDMFKGLVHGFLMAYWIFKDLDPDFLREVRPYAERVPLLKVAQSGNSNKSVALGLKAVFSQSSGDFNHYLRVTGSTPAGILNLNLETTFNVVGILDFSGIHLSTVATINEILIAEFLQWSPYLKAYREQLFDLWWRTKDSHRTLTSIATIGYAIPHLRIKKHRRDDLARGLDRLRWGLREVPAPKLRLSVSIDHSLNPKWTMAPYPRMPWKYWSQESKPIEWFYQAQVEPAHFYMDAFDEKYIWKNGGYDFRLDTWATTQNSGVDYLYAYWMARYFGLPL
jgi:hypothetical protein